MCCTFSLCLGIRGQPHSGHQPLSDWSGLPGLLLLLLLLLLLQLYTAHPNIIVKSKGKNLNLNRFASSPPPRVDLSYHLQLILHHLNFSFYNKVKIHILEITVEWQNNIAEQLTWYCKTSFSCVTISWDTHNTLQNLLNIKQRTYTYSLKLLCIWLIFPLQKVDFPPCSNRHQSLSYSRATPLVSRYLPITGQYPT